MLQAGRINHMYFSQNSLILCFIILIFKWLIIVERGSLPAPFAWDVHLCTALYLYRLNYAAHTPPFHSMAAACFSAANSNVTRLT